MKEVQDGLFAVEEQMPCSPNDIRISRYALPGTLERAEREEAAARILSFSLELNQWVGVSWPRVVGVMKSDYEMEKDVSSAQKHNWDEEWRVKDEMWMYCMLCLITLGFYALFVSKPTAQLREVQDKEVPFSIIFLMGPQAVENGARELIDQGMIRCVQEGDGENSFDVLFPTPALVSHVMQKQGVVVT